MVLKVLSETLTECAYCTGTKVGLSVGELSSGGKVLQKLLILAIYHHKKYEKHISECTQNLSSFITTLRSFSSTVVSVFISLAKY